MIQREKENELFGYFDEITYNIIIFKEDEEIRPYENKINTLVINFKSEFNQNVVLETDITNYINILLSRSYIYFCGVKDFNHSHYNLEYPESKSYCLFELMQFALVDLQEEIINVIQSIGKSNLLNQKRIKECLIFERKHYLNQTETEDQPITPDTKNSINWQGTNLEFTELVKALL
jgi:hypothetical protein